MCKTRDRTDTIESIDISNPIVIPMKIKKQTRRRQRAEYIPTNSPNPNDIEKWAKLYIHVREKTPPRFHVRDVTPA